jgi:protein involved in sex pheromone biosynthesis
MKKLIFITVLAVTLFSSSCTDDVGGNADMSTVDFNVQSSEWVEYGTKGEVGYGYAVDLVFPELTNNVIQNGMVSLYIKTGDAWIPVPVYFYNQTDQYLYQGGYFYRIKQGVFSIDYYESDGYTSNPGTQIFRLVIVQPI